MSVYIDVLDRPALRLHDRGDLVKALQRLIGAKDDGFYGPATARAVAAMREKYGIGEGDATLRLLLILTGSVSPPQRPPVSVFDDVAATIDRIHTGFPISDIVNDLPRKNVPQKDISRQAGIVIHHSATDSKSAGSNPYSYARYHTATLNWPCIGYDTVIQPLEPHIYRTANLQDRNYHAGNQNSLWYGICISGNYDIEEPTDLHYRLIVAAIFDLIARHEKLTGKRWDPDIQPHSKFSTKTCPGRKFDMARIRRMVSDQRQ
jgi:peptidoglycan hydrolase-like protein with peptidoglycan-binding domain